MPHLFIISLSDTTIFPTPPHPLPPAILIYKQTQ